VDIKTDVHKSAQATRGGTQKGCQCILPPPAAFDDARHAPLTEDFDKIDQKHHPKTKKLIIKACLDMEIICIA
jgi:hypothetical protein